MLRIAVPGRQRNDTGRPPGRRRNPETDTSKQQLGHLHGHKKTATRRAFFDDDIHSAVTQAYYIYV